MKVALFDLDGVLVDTEPGYSAFWKGVGEDYFPQDTGFASGLKGQSLTCIFQRYFPDDFFAQQTIRKRLSTYEATMEFPIFPGALQYVEKLHRRGVKTAVVTSSDTRKMDCLYSRLPDFRSLFDAIFTAEDVSSSKPAPDCYLTAARYFGVSPTDCVVFEDSPNGLQAGRSSGAYVVGVASALSLDAIRPLCDKPVKGFADISELASLDALFQS